MKLPIVIALSTALLAGCGVAHADPAIPSTTCDPSVAWAYPDGRDGVAVYVKTPGPDVVWVDINGATRDDHRRLQQQVTKRAIGAQFDFMQLIDFKASSITVGTREWTCTIDPPGWLHT